MTLKLSVWTALMLAIARLSHAEPIMVGSVTENLDGTFTYEYVVSGVDPGRKVTGAYWVLIEGLGAPAPAYLPLSWTVPSYWTMQSGHAGPVPGGVWMSNTGQNYSVPGRTKEIPIGANSGTLLDGDTRQYSFTTGYAPRLGTYVLVENENGSEIGYQFLTGTVLLPDYDGSRIETTPTSDNFNIPPPDPSARVPEPSSLILLTGGLCGVFWAQLRRRVVAADPRDLPAPPGAFVR